MKITIDIPNEIAEQFTETPDQLPRHLLEILVIEAYLNDRITHFQVGQILKLPSRWAVDEFLKNHHVYLHYNEKDFASDRQTMHQLRAND